MIAFLAIAVAVGLAAGAGIGYVVFDEEPVDEKSYWIYLSNTDSDVDGWYEIVADDPVEAFVDLAAEKELQLNFEWGEYGFSLLSFDGKITQDLGGSNWVYWSLGVWDSENSSWTYSPTSLNGVTTNIFCYAYGDGTLPTTGYQNEGPFA